MANTITHIAVAKELLESCPSLIKNERAYYLGSIAPDTITGKPNAERADKKRVHLREDISDAQWLESEQMEIFTNRIKSFVQENIKNEKNEDQRDFNIGYLVHLLTDKCNHATVRQKLLEKAKERGFVSSDKEFYHMCVNDLEALDAYLLENRPEIEKLFTDLISKEVDYCLHGWIEAEYMKNGFWWWENHYLPGIKERKLLYIATKDIEDFITYSVKKIAEELKELIG